MTGTDNPATTLTRMRSQMQAERHNAQEADPLSGVRNSAFFETQRWKDQQWRALRDGAHPDLIVFEAAFHRAMRKLNIPTFAHNMVRDDAHQNALYVQGVTKSKAGKSPHNYGLAVDIVHSTKAWDLTPEQWAVFGHVGKEVAKRLAIPIIWGGDWKFFDPAHWELENWRTLKNWKLEAAGKELQLRLQMGSLY